MASKVTNKKKSGPTPGTAKWRPSADDYKALTDGSADEKLSQHISKFKMKLFRTIKPDSAPLVQQRNRQVAEYQSASFCCIFCGVTKCTKQENDHYKKHVSVSMLASLKIV